MGRHPPWLPSPLSSLPLPPPGSPLPPPPCWPPLPSLAFWEPLSLLRVSVSVFCSVTPQENRDVSGGPKSLGLDSSFAIISQLEPAQCIRRLICDVASGALPADESDE